MKESGKVIQARPIQWPEGKRFAFTIVDDTDRAVLANIKPVYDFLAEQGFRTTKTVWPLESRERHITGGDSLENRAYCEWILDLKRQGFEIALHGVADEPSTRDRVELGLDRFRDVVGMNPSMHINHVGQAEGMYWGGARLDPPARWAYALYRRLHAGAETYEGHMPGTKYFWGDLCKDRIHFVRNFVWPDINTLKMDPLMPYHDQRRPYVRSWFSSSYGSGLKSFLQLLSPANQDRLAAEGGACIVYTHLGSGFFPIATEFVDRMKRLASLPGWFVPASTLLRYIGQRRGWNNTADCRAAYKQMQVNWLYQQFRRRMS